MPNMDSQLVLRNRPRSLLREMLDGIDSGQEAVGRSRKAEAERLTLKELASQRKREEDARAEEAAYRKTLKGVMQVDDFTTPEGQRQGLQSMARLGYGPRLVELMGNLPKPERPEYDIYDAQDGAYAIDKRNPAKKIALGIKKYEKPVEPKPTPRKLEKAADGTLVSVDETTGLGPDGKPVKFWRDPKSPKLEGPSQSDMRSVFEMEQKLAKDFTGRAQKSIDVATAYNKIDASIKQNNPLDAYNAIVQFVKIIDPGTAAREGEVQSAVLSASGGIGEKLQQAARKAYNGTLDPTTAQNILGSARALLGAEKKTYDAAKADTKAKIESYRKRNYQLDDRAILGDYDSLFPIDPPPAPPQGVVDIKGDEDFDKLPPGTRFRGPDGKVRVKP